MWLCWCFEFDWSLMKRISNICLIFAAGIFKFIWFFLSTRTFNSENFLFQKKLTCNYCAPKIYLTFTPWSFTLQFLHSRFLCSKKSYLTIFTLKALIPYNFHPPINYEWTIYDRHLQLLAAQFLSLSPRGPQDAGQLKVRTNIDWTPARLIHPMAD